MSLEEKKYLKILDLIKEYTGHTIVKLLSRGNAAIFSALVIAKKNNPKPFLLIPDQGGWISFQKYPQMLGFELRTIKTNRGIIDLIDLEEKASSGSALLLTSFAGYFAEQPLSYISNICKKNKCLIIEDASGAISDSILCNSEFSDIIIGSFGKWKPVNNNYGGFLALSNKEMLEKAKDIFSADKFYPFYDKLLVNLSKVPDRITKNLELQSKVKKDLLELNLKVLHPDKRGLNVVVKPFNSDDREKILSYCKKNNYEYVECPKYIRVEEDAISIELKRLDFDK